MEPTAETPKLYVYHDYFKGREDYFAFQTTSIYKPINLPFDNSYLDKHLKKISTFGIYVLTKDSECHLVCIDIDIPKKDLNKVNFKDKHEKYHALAPSLNKILDVLKNDFEIDDSCILLEETGGRGYHLWLFFDSAVSAKYAIAFFELIKSNINDYDYEYFPKQAQLKSKKKLGNLIKLPLGVHQKYGEESKFFKITSDKIELFGSIEENINHLETIKKLNSDDFINAIQNKQERDINEDAEIFPDLLESKERVQYIGDLNFLFNNCKALLSLKEKCENNIQLSYNEAFNLANVLLSIKDGKVLLISLLKKSYGAKFNAIRTNKEIERIIALHPTSCRRLIYHGICKSYCTKEIEDRNNDALLRDTTPLGAWLVPSKQKLSISKEQILNAIIDKDNIRRAFSQLKKYHKWEDALFYDEFDFLYFEKNFEANLHHISGILSNKEYIPFTGFLRVDVPKKVDKHQRLQFRPMSYCAVFDEVIIQSIFNVISIVLEDRFSQHSYGYRFDVSGSEWDNIFYDWRELYPKFRNNVLEEIRNPDNKYYVCCDIKKYYDNINHDILMQQIIEYIEDPYLLSLLKSIIDVYQIAADEKKGVPQGPAYPRILANLYLNDFDKEVQKITSGYFRYVDDCFLFFKNIEDAKNGMSIVNKLLAELNLELSYDESKSPEILETSDDKKIIEKIDSLRYGIFDEFRIVEHYEVEEVHRFYDSVEKHQVKTTDLEELLKVNSILPSLLYLVSIEFNFSIPIKEKIPLIIDYLVEQNLFYPKRLKKIYYNIIELYTEQGIEILSLFNKSNDTHKIFFLLSLYGIFKKHNKYIQELELIIENCLETRNPFLIGYAIAIKYEIHGNNVPDININIIKRVIQSKSYFSKLKLLTFNDYYKLNKNARILIREFLLTDSNYLLKKYLIRNIRSYYSEYIEDKFLLNLIRHESYMYIPEMCSLFALSKSPNNLFHGIQNLFSKLVNYKGMIIHMLSLYLAEHCKSGNLFLDNLNEFIDEVKDTEIKRELKNIINRITDREKIIEDSYYRYHTLVCKDYDCYLYQADDKSGLDHDYLEVIPVHRLGIYGFNDIEQLKRDIEKLSIKEIFPSLDFEYDSNKNEILLKYHLPDDFTSCTNVDLSIDTESLIKAFKLTNDIFKKSVYVHRLFGFIPFIDSSNLFINIDKAEIRIVNFSSFLVPIYNIGKTTVHNHLEKEIPVILSNLLKDLIFKSNDSDINKFNSQPKDGAQLFLWHFLKRFELRDHSKRYSHSRFNYLINELAAIDIGDKSKITNLYFIERIKAILFNNNKDNINWANVCKAILEIYHELCNLFPIVDFEKIKFENKVFFNLKLPKKMHYLAKEIVNVNLNVTIQRNLQ